MQLQCFFQIGQRSLFRRALAGDINLEALGDSPISFVPNRCGKWTFHDLNLAQGIMAIQLRMRRAGSGKMRS
jgi:hypothetical protein